MNNILILFEGVVELNQEDFLSNLFLFVKFLRLLGYPHLKYYFAICSREISEIMTYTFGFGDFAADLLAST